MRVFVVTVAKRQLLSAVDSAERERRISSALNDPVWLNRAVERHETWTSPNGIVRIDVVSNEPDITGPLIHRNAHGRTAATWTGYIDEASFAAERPDPGIVARLHGIFALAMASDDGVDGFTCVHRGEPVYVAEGADVHVLSSSARAAHRVAGIPDRSVPLDALLGLSGWGRMINDVTPFPGVTTVPRNAHITVRPSGTSVSQLPSPDIDPAAPIDEHVEFFVDALVAAAMSAKRSSGAVEVFLTGGKDSRLAAVALAAAGHDFAAVTVGHQSHPDVVLASRVAAALGIPHSVMPNATDGGLIEVRPVQRAYQVIRGCEGMVSCYDLSSLLISPYDAAYVVVGGHGGELLRGGTTVGIDAPSPKEVKERLMDRFAPHYDLLVPASRARLDEIMSPWHDAFETDVLRGDEELFLTLVAGRWHAVLRSARSIAAMRRELLADNQLVRIAAAIDQEAAASGTLAHAALHRIRPDLCAIPFTGDRWGFEAKGPTRHCDPDGWLDRIPLPTRGGAAWNWRERYPEDMHRHFVDTILSAPLFDDLLDRRRTEEFLAGAESPNRSYLHVRLSWAMYTAGQLLNGLAAASALPEGPLFQFPIPDAARDSSFMPHTAVRVDGKEFRQCNLCDAILSRNEIDVRCPRCGLGAEHRGLQYVLDNYGDVFHGRSVLVLGPTTPVPPRLLHSAADVMLLDHAGPPEADTILNAVPDSTRDAVLILQPRASVTSPTMVQNAARILRPGGVMVAVEPPGHPDAGTESSVPPLVEWSKALGLSVTVFPGLDPVLRRTALVTLAYRAV